ncbi:MAG TPA: GNAT family N-acetyltransferase [Bacteroidia bacterium]|nr:GNAT family N-acetyltransferase [Bacteroidia bacterium]
MLLIVKEITSNEELSSAFSIRKSVFVGEQNVPEEMELDEFEDQSRHYLALLGNKPVATARWRQTPKGIKLERFAVLPEYRMKGVAAQVLRTMLADVPETTVYLHAQITAVGFYEKYGFLKKGDPFDEAGIMHFVMHLEKHK